jgi:hypothetical protein
MIADITQFDQSTLLFAAIFSPNDSDLQLLLENGADPNFPLDDILERGRNDFLFRCCFGTRDKNKIRLMFKFGGELCSSSGYLHDDMGFYGGDSSTEWVHKMIHKHAPTISVPRDIQSRAYVSDMRICETMYSPVLINRLGVNCKFKLPIDLIRLLYTYIGIIL